MQITETKNELTTASCQSKDLFLCLHFLFYPLFPPFLQKKRKKAGPSPPKKPTTAHMVDCPHEGCTNSFYSEKNLRTHLKSAHGIDGAAALSAAAAAAVATAATERHRFPAQIPPPLRPCYSWLRERGTQLRTRGLAPGLHGPCC